jgi:hypothetical protein
MEKLDVEIKVTDKYLEDQKKNKRLSLSKFRVDEINLN